jgi:biotin synthase
MPALIEAAFAVRQQHFGRRVKLCVLQNARSGLCPEDCHYCSQSAVSDAPIPRYRLLPRDELIAGARRAVASGATRYCMVTSGRGPTSDDISRLADAARAIKDEFPRLELCLSLGLLGEPDAETLAKAGVGWINHNLNTSRRFYPSICTTHTYDDRIATIEAVRRAGLMTCCGGIVGMGENDEDLIDLAYALRELRADSIPVNFLQPIAGTPLEHAPVFDRLRGLKTLCLMRLLNPVADVRMASGRELHLGPDQALALYPANSIFVSGYLTTPGQAADDARRMIEGAGFEVEA